MQSKVIVVLRAPTDAGKPTPTHAVETVGVGLAETDGIMSGDRLLVGMALVCRQRPTRSPRWKSLPSPPRPSQINVP
jgi:hypothetical protein